MRNSQIETYTLASWAKEKGLTRCFIYHGMSMRPTFKNGDFLYVRPVTKSNVSVGDVVVFIRPNHHSYIVHRIVAISDKGLFTRGDHNLRIDAMPVAMEHIAGKVELVENKHGIRRLVNGTSGLWLSRIWRSLFTLDRLIRRVFWMPYSFVREKRLAAIFWRPEISKMQIQLGNNQQIKYIYKNRTVATWDPSRRRFECRKPFDLVIPSPLEERELSVNHAELG